MADKLNLRAKLLNMMQVIGGVPKRGTAPVTQGSYTYQMAADIFPKVQKACRDHGVMFLASEVSRQPRAAHQSKAGAAVFVEDVTMRYSFLDTESEERIDGDGSGVAFDNSDKALNKAKTAALKYFLKQTFLIGEKEDDPEAHDTTGGEGVQWTTDGNGMDAEEFYPDPSTSFQASSDEPVTDAQALSVTQWCKSFGVDFKAVFGPWFSVDRPEKMTNPQYAVFLEKRDAIVLGYNQRDNPPSKDIAKAEKIINQAQERVRQQTAPSIDTNAGITEGKQRRFYAIAKSKEVAKQVLDQFGFDDPAQIPWRGDIYDKMCKAAEEANS
jgi:hypothetical protein